MNRQEALELVQSWTKNKNLVKHMLAVEAQMKALARYFNERPAFVKDFGEASEEEWGLVGLIHDADYERWPEEHPMRLVEELMRRDAPKWLVDAVASHAWGYQDDLPEPKTKMEWALYTCDELSGFIVACALVRPDKKLASLTVDSVLKKWPQKAFAAGVNRDQIELCEEKLGIPLKEFIDICLKALQDISEDLGL